MTLILFACATSPLPDHDKDNDGFITTVDCDDRDAAVNPAAAEACNGRDDDCNGVVDDTVDSSTVYVDGDADGFGNAAQPLLECPALPAEGTVSNKKDCDDSDAAIHPDADEICDEVDNDCDGEIDERPETPTLFRDQDGDGYGDPDGPLMDCEDSASGYVANSQDCNDNSAEVAPDKSESCLTPFDDNCDGSVLERDAEGCWTWYYDEDGDAWGTDAGSVCDCAPSAPYTSSVTDDCDDAEALVNPGQPEICGDGLDNDCDGQAFSCAFDGDMTLVDVADATWTGEDGSHYLSHAAGLGDVDGDGFGDLVVSSLYWGGGRGAAYYISGADVLSGLDLDSGAGVRLEGAGSAEGRPFAGGDLDGDGDMEFLIGGGWTASGRIYVFDGGPTQGGLSEASSIEIVATDAGSEDWGFGYSAAALSDHDEDGAGEFVAGAPYHDGNGGDSGALFLFQGLTSAEDTDGADEAIVGTTGGDLFAYSVVDAGDMNGDGVGDLVVGAPGYGDAGAVYVLAGPISSSDSIAPDGFAVWLVEGEASGDQAGASVGALGDRDDDGLKDALVGAPMANGEAGAAYLLHGDSKALSTGLLADARVRIDGDPGSRTGTSVVGAGDMDGDGRTDALVGAPYTARNGAFLFYGTMSGTLTTADADAAFLGENSGDRAGVVVATAGDVDGDDRDDLLIGADFAAGDLVGSVYLVLGSKGDPE